MSTLSKQKSVAPCPYTEALRYMDNAEKTLAKAGIEYESYIDQKYVRTACGTAYNGVLIAVGAWLKAKGVVKQGKGRPSIEYYVGEVAKLDGKLKVELNNAYNTLHLSGYYDGNQDSTIIKRGFKLAFGIIERINPAQAA